jgi:anti-sigma regulatory factor (Ser/Thr protein kinase)
LTLTTVVNDDGQTRTFSVTVEGVAAVDSWVEHVAAQWGLSERAVFGARLCIAELAANVLEHGAARSSNDSIVVRIDRLRDGIEVEFLDSRQPFDPTAPRSIANAPAHSGGRGLVLLQAYAHDLTYVADGDYNRTKFRVSSN